MQSKQRKTGPPGWVWGIGVVVGLIVVIDRSLKVWALSLPVGGGFFIGDSVGLGLFQNTQAVFGIPRIPFVFDSLVLCVGIFLAYASLRAFRNREQWMFFGLLMILTGGASNILDRFRHGFVVDFIYAGSAVFNLADAMIAAGFAIAALQLFAKKGRHYSYKN